MGADYLGADSMAAAVAAAGYIGATLSDYQKAQLIRLHAFLSEEAVKAGGIGPNEIGRLWERHIADSLVFGAELSSRQDCLDIGTGVGLPGIPLAIVFPDVRFTLLDRAERRIGLARRACAILQLANCELVQCDVDRFDRRHDFIVSRASLRPDEVMIHVKRLLNVSGVAMIGLSRTASDDVEPTADVPELRTKVIRVPDGVLDTHVSLLRIEATSQHRSGLED